MSIFISCVHISLYETSSTERSHLWAIKLLFMAVPIQPLIMSRESSGDVDFEIEIDNSMGR